MGRQLRLLLWKDYLIRKRKWVTLAGVAWALAVIMSLYIVRVNTNNVDYSTCQFRARALPSAGLLTFLQSFICNVNNDCSPLDRFQEVPSYEDSKLTHLQRKFSPLLYNESVLDVAASVPDALKLLSKLAEMADEPMFVGISGNGLRVQDLFYNPTKVRRYVTSHLDIDYDVADSLMTSQLSFQGILKEIDRCSSASVSEALVMPNPQHLDILVEKLCSMTTKDVQGMMMDLLLEIDFYKFIKMLGNMYYKLSGDGRLGELAGTVAAVLRMTRQQSFLPAELKGFFRDVDFSYIHLNLTQSLMDLFKPTFSDTKAYRSIRDVADMTVVGARYLNRFLTEQADNTVEEVAGLVGNIAENREGLENVGKALNNAVAMLKETMASDTSADVVNISSQLTNFIYKWLPDNLKHDVLLYSTLLTRLIEGAQKVININMNIEERAYNVSLRHPDAIRILERLPRAVVEQGFEALTDADRTQIATGKINTPGQMFCDVNKIQSFFNVGKSEAAALKSQLCTDAWRSYVADLVQSFGIYEVRDNINTMASLFIQETLGKDITDQLYPLDHDFLVLRNFTQSLSSIESGDKPELNWSKLFNVSEDSEFIKAIRSKGHLGKQILVTVHGSLAKEVINMNTLLSIKIAPVLIDTTILVTALNNQLDATDAGLFARVREVYPGIVQTVLATALDENKTYKSLSTHSEDIACSGVETAAQYLQLPSTSDEERLVSTLCEVSTAIENGLKPDSLFGKAVKTVRTSNHDMFAQVPWSALVSGLKTLYVTLDRECPYLFQYSSYGMDKGTRGKVEDMFVQAKQLWFGSDLGKSLHLSMKLGLRLLDLVDRELFSVSGPVWLKTKYGLHSVGGPLRVLDDVVKLVTALYRNETVPSELPAATVAALTQVIPNIPQLIVEATDLILRDDTDVTPLISLLNTAPYWPCSSTSMSSLLTLGLEASRAVRTLESLLCVDQDLEQEWRVYLEGRDVESFDMKKWNTTKLKPHVFLRFSAAFDSLTVDSSLLVDTVQDMASNDGAGGLSWKMAAQHAVEVFNSTERDSVLRKFFTKFDEVLNSITTPQVTDALPLNSLWTGYLSCSNGSMSDCRTKSREVWKYSLQFFSVMFDNVGADLLTYFKEINESNSNLLQLAGFTRNTILYQFYERLPDYFSVLLNSYWDYGFMSQVRRASLSQFWDCEAVLLSLTPPPDSPIDPAALRRVQPYVCPSLLYWLSLPRGENVLLDVVAKPNYFLYNLEVQNLTSSYTDAYSKLSELTNLLTDIAKKNISILNEEDLRLNTIEGKLERTVDAILKYKMNGTDETYRLFNEITKKQFASTIYLTRIVTIVNKLTTAIEELAVDDITDSANEDSVKKAEADLVAIQNIFKRKPNEAIALHFDVITNLIWEVNDEYNLINALEVMCNDYRNNDTRKDILVDNQRVKAQICSRNYQVMYNKVEKVVEHDYGKAKASLLNLVRVLQNDDNLDNVVNINEFLTQRDQQMNSLRNSIQYSYELGIPVYLQYLQSTLQHYDVILTFLSGDDWWEELRRLYHGPYASQFFDSLEKTFDISEDVMGNLDKIHLVRLLRDVDVNNSDAFCEPGVVMSDYFPDTTGVLSLLKRQMCEEDKVDLLRELPPLLFASQGYDIRLKLPTTVNYTALDLDISETESRLNLIREGPRTPMGPPWVTDEGTARLRGAALKLLSKETLTRVSFGMLSNLVDAGTLFLNNSQCRLCSQLTPWLKQLNLQVIKKQEYDALLCRAADMTDEELAHALRTDFHWDMAVSELISTRNYTKYELNKSMNEFLELVKLHLLEDLLATSTKLSECLARNVSRNEFGNATLFVSVLSHTTRLLYSMTPHLHEIKGIQDLPYLKQLHSEVAHNLDVVRPLRKYLKRAGLKELGVEEVLGADVNLRTILDSRDMSSVRLKNTSWEAICQEHNCDQIVTIVYNHLDRDLIEEELPKLQSAEFWRFTFLSNILKHLEALFGHISRLLGVSSKVDVIGVAEGRLAPLIDFGMQILMDDTMDGVLYSLQGLAEELHPLLQGAPLEYDLGALARGLAVLHQFKGFLLEKGDLKVEVSKWLTWRDPEHVELALGRLGINNTNFWSLAAPRLRAGHIDLKPIFSTKQGDYHISNFVCQPEAMASVLLPADLGVVTADDVYGAVAEQFCGLDDRKAREVAGVLLTGLNFAAVVDKIKDLLLPQLYAASNLTRTEGDQVLERLPRMAALLPIIQNNVGDLTETLANEPLIQDLGKSGSLGGLLGSSQFLSHAGEMLCGRPFETGQNRFYKAVASSPDFSSEPDQAQLDSLPTDYCRDLYKNIINMEGGKIAWSIVKPLIMGKILYSPARPDVDRIMRQANSSFAHMMKLTSLVHSFAGSFSSLEALSRHRAGVAALRDVIAAPELAALLFGGDSVGSRLGIGLDVNSLFDRIDDVQGIGSLLKKGSDLLHCVNLNRFRAVSDEYQLTHEAVRLSRVNEFSAGIVFLNAEQKGDAPLNVEYKIRMDIENAPTTTRKQNYLWIPGPESSFIEHMRYFRGFIQIQDLVDRAVIALSRSHGRRKRETDDVKWAVYMQQEPYPCYRKDFFQTSLYESQALLVAFFFSLLFTVSSAVRFIVADKESGNTMLMSVMGVNLTNHTLSWALASLAEMAVTITCMTVVLSAGGILPRTSPSLVFALLFVFTLSVLSFCNMISKLFSSASAAAVCAALAYLMTFMPFVLILSLEAVLTSALKLLVCLSMSSAICYSFLYIARFEAMGSGVGWSDVWSAPDGTDMSIAMGAIMALVDAAIYLSIGYLLDRYFGPRTLQSSITHCHASGEKAGVSVVNVTKCYGHKLALDNVSVELHQGQVTTLLGHNGAGKTTLINILMGMLNPTKGHIIIRSEREGTRVGMCPQRNVLFEYMTPSEHVALYAQLKSGRPLIEVQDEVDSILRVLSLGPVAHEPATRLSGGTRRRLCVALAFVARPHLVSLDEPTAGVDPAARREIWSMIVKLRENRTILMTTHHMDEAELLSDQIVIMHKGQVHTTGSPIEIKRSLGNGYKLTVMFPDKPVDRSWADEKIPFEERTKRLLAVVREGVKNAALVDVNGLEVEFGLPFFDANGLNNDFLQLCTLLETRQTELAFKSYSMDCSSLEQVFFNICQQAETPHRGIEYDPDTPSKSASTSSMKSDMTPIVPAEGPLRGSSWDQFVALLHARYLHYTRNRWLLFLLIILPSLFVATAMGFSMIRPPADNEISLLLNTDLYGDTTQYLVAHPSIYSENYDPSFAERVMENLYQDKQTRNWTTKDTPVCKCTETHQECELNEEDYKNPQMMLLPDVSTLNNWIVSSHDRYIEKRYGGFTSSITNNLTHLIAWYNNKGHHAMPAYLNALNTAILRTVSGDSAANITAYSHPLKISKEQISKDTVYQHVADAGISTLVVLAYSLVSGGAAVYLVSARTSQEKRLQLLCGASPALYWAAAMVADMAIVVINLVITVIVFKAFGFAVFVVHNNLPAICILILLYGFACGSLVHVAEKLFSEPSMANMLLFCGNAFVGLAGITLLLILDVISESDATEYARWILHKILMLCPQFVLGDGLLEICKNTIQAEVLSRFGMDTYKDPLSSDLIAYHYVALVLVGILLTLLNLAIEYGYFEGLLDRFRRSYVPERTGEMEDLEVAAERRRVRATHAHAERPVRLPTIGNINAGFVDTVVKNNSIKRVVSPASDVAQVVDLAKVYPGLRARRVAVRSLTLGIPPGQCMALLGENGAGKSTTFSMLTGEIRPTAGTIYLAEKQVDPRKLCRGLISYCPQSDAVDPLLTVRETLAFYCRLRAITDRDEVIKRTMDIFLLSKYASVRASALSGGNRRKLCSAIAFMGRTPLVLLDEPTSGMDPGSRACVSRGVQSACAAQRGVLLSTHALDDARRLAARVALMREGELCALAPLAACLERFGGGYVVSCRVSRGAPRAVWRRVRALASHASLRVLHHASLHFLLPLRATVDKQEITTCLSDIFKLMAELQSTCDIEDFTVNQSSLDQMFFSFAEKTEEELDPLEVEPLPSPRALRRNSSELNSITSL